MRKIWQILLIGTALSSQQSCASFFGRKKKEEKKEEKEVEKKTPKKKRKKCKKEEKKNKQWLIKGGVPLTTLFVTLSLIKRNSVSPEVATEMQNALSHPKQVNCIAFAEGKNYLATGGRDHIVRLFNLNDKDNNEPKKFVRKKDGNRGCYIMGMCFSADEKYLAVGFQDAKLFIWEVESSNLVYTFSHTHGEKEFQDSYMQGIMGIDWSKNKRYITTAGYGGVNIWKLTYNKESQKLLGGTLLRSLDVKQGNVHCVKFSKDNRLIAAGGCDCNVHVWDTKTGKLKYVLKGHKKPINSLFWMQGAQQNQDFILSASSDGLICKFNLESSLPQVIYHGHQGPVHAIAHFPGSDKMISGGIDKKLYLWDMKYGNLLHTYTNHKMPIHDIVCLSKKSFASASGAAEWYSNPSDNSVHLIEIDSSVISKVSQRSTTNKEYDQYLIEQNNKGDEINLFGLDNDDTKIPLGTFHTG